MLKLFKVVFMNKIIVCEVIVLNERREILLQLRDDRPGLVGAGKWGLFGGTQESGETPLAAIKRELKEELDWETSPELIGQVEDNNNNIVYEHWLYRCLFNGEAASLLIREGKEARFFNLASLDILDKVEWFDRVYKETIFKLLNK